jgi:Flp pilus assembly protein TadG
MRMRGRVNDERGATAVLLTIMLVVLIAILALALDGGLLLAKYREVRRASDAAALAAAISCAKQEANPDATGAATASAAQYADANVVDPQEAAAAAPIVTFKDINGNPTSPNSCNGLAAGQVTVQYTVKQSLVFGPAVGVSSPKDVSATATATWGTAASLQNLIPLTLAEGSELSKCTVAPDGTQPAIGATCKLYWDGNDSANGKWGIIDMRQQYWNTDPSLTGCNSNGSAALVNGQPNDPTSGWMASVSGSWFTSTPTSPNAYVYVCSADGGQGNDLTNAVNTKVAFPHQDIVYMPVFRPSANIVANGGDVYKYAVVGFAALRVRHAYQGLGPDQFDGQNALGACGITDQTGNGNSRCLVATWQGFQTGGLTLGGGNDFGVKAVVMTQ